jgi:protein SCO1/2
VVATEDGRRLSVAEAPPAVPSVQAALASGESGTLPALLARDGRVTLATFIYTRCNAVCSVLGTEMQQLQREIRARGLQGRVRLLSISFDAHDTPGVLAAYAQRMQADPAIWHFAAIPDTAERSKLLAQFGVLIIPAPLGEFQHNAAFHTLTPTGRLTAITDYDSPIAELVSTLGSDPKVDTSSGAGIVEAVSTFGSDPVVDTGSAAGAAR